MSVVDEIEARVRPTICPSYSSRGYTVEGRILEADFEILLALARERNRLVAEHADWRPVPGKPS